jgi:hypothetical protein
MKKTRIPSKRYADCPPIHQVNQKHVLGRPDVFYPFICYRCQNAHAKPPIVYFDYPLLAIVPYEALFHQTPRSLQVLQAATRISLTASPDQHGHVEAREFRG